MVLYGSPPTSNARARPNFHLFPTREAFGKSIPSVLTRAWKGLHGGVMVPFGVVRTRSGASGLPAPRPYQPVAQALGATRHLADAQDVAAGTAARLARPARHGYFPSCVEHEWHSRVERPRHVACMERIWHREGSTNQNASKDINFNHRPASPLDPLKKRFRKSVLLARPLVAYIRGSTARCGE